MSHDIPSCKSVAKFLLVGLLLSLVVAVGRDTDDIGLIQRWARSLATRLDGILIRDIPKVFKYFRFFKITGTSLKTSRIGKLNGILNSVLPESLNKRSQIFEKLQKQLKNVKRPKVKNIYI